MLSVYKRYTLIFIIISTVLRIFLASSLELGNDEVYYWLYAKYPAISHFDHPPMVGFFIQFFTFNLFFDNELAIRLAAIIPISLAMYIIFLIASTIKNDKVGFIAVLLCNLNIYTLVISGTFILPDAPMILFWLLGFYFFIQSITEVVTTESKTKLLLGFLFTAFAIYSKYQAIYLLFGVVLYVVSFRRQWLKTITFYLGFIFPLIAIGLIFYWNYTNDFISYKFHGNRVSFFSGSFNSTAFLREILGQIIYNNPYLFYLSVLFVLAVYKKKLTGPKLYFILFCSLPLLLTTIYLSIYRNTLPHWSGIAYITLIPGLALLIEKIPIRRLVFGFAFMLILLITALFSVNKGLFIPVDNSRKKERLGKNDVTLDMFGWKQASDKILSILIKKQLTQLPIVSNNWYPAAHIDYYIARPNNMKVYGLGNLANIHKYYWINTKYKPLEKEVLYITDSRNYKNPSIFQSNGYQKSELIQKTPILRNGVVVKYVFVYKLFK